MQENRRPLSTVGHGDTDYIIYVTGVTTGAGVCVCGTRSESPELCRLPCHRCCVTTAVSPSSVNEQVNVTDGSHCYSAEDSDSAAGVWP